jgi:hypothetical protein
LFVVLLSCCFSCYYLIYIASALINFQLSGMDSLRQLRFSSIAKEMPISSSSTSPKKLFINSSDLYHRSRSNPHYSGLPTLLLSASLSIAFLHNVRSGNARQCALGLQAYSAIIRTGSRHQKRQVANSGAWPVLIAFLGHDNQEVVGAAADAMKSLTINRSGEDYARFIEEGLFDELMKYLPPLPEAIPVELNFTVGGAAQSETFEALGWMWFPVFSVSR